MTNREARQESGCPDAPMRLQRFLARAGVASRRHAEELISAGRVTVDGTVASLGMSVDPSASLVRVDGGEPLSIPDAAVAIMLHKPAGYVTTMSDPQGRQSVASLVPTGRYPGLFPVGRLDRDTTGLLIFTTDGDLGQALLHPSKHVEKRYFALVEGRPNEAELQKLRDGIMLDDGLCAPARAELLFGTAANEAAKAIGSGDDASGNHTGHEGKRAHEKRKSQTSYVLIGLKEGKKRQVRRMLQAVGHPVVALHRQSFGSLDLGELPRGQWRSLNSSELEMLRACAH